MTGSRNASRRGSARPLRSFASGAAVVAAALAVLWWMRPGDEAAPPGTAGPLLVHCAAGVRLPVEAAAKEYGKACGVSVRFQYGASQTLLAGLELAPRGDLYIPADDSYVRQARGKRIAEEILPLAKMRAVLAVAKGNPKGVRSLAGLATGDVRLVQANPDAAAVGKVTRDALRRAGLEEALRARTVAFKPTVSDVANDIKLGTADAGFIWDATVRQMPALESVPVPELEGAEGHVSACVLAASEQPTAALRFARWLAARDRGQQAFAAHGYIPVDGDPWEEMPELRLFSGAMLRPAIEETLNAFERREGVRITRVYGGCGILCGQMRAGERPDAYFACDTTFLDQVQDLYEPGVRVAENGIVIAVPAGNPRGIRAAADLARAGFRIGVANEKQSTLGALTRTLLEGAKLFEAVQKNVTVQSPTADYLINQLRTGSLDAVVVYVSNVNAAPGGLEMIRIDLPGALAVQPYAVGKGTSRRELALRLRRALLSPASKARFERYGWRWLVEAGVE